MAGWQPEYLILHDYGGSPGPNPGFNPYHALVSGGKLNYRYPEAPYGQKAPHAYHLNPNAIGLSWGGPVGGTPNAAEFALLKQEYENILKQYPHLQVLSHGEAFNARKQGLPRASKSGRGLDEASWRTYLRDGKAYPGLSPPMALGGPEPELVSGPTPASKPWRPALRAITAGHPNESRPSVAMNSGSAGVSPTAAGASPAMLTNAGRQSTDQTIDPTTMVGAPSGAMLTNYGRNTSPNTPPTSASAPPPVETSSTSPAAPSTPIGPKGPTWAELMNQQMLSGSPALQGSLSSASPVNKSSPQYKNTLIGMLGGIF